MGSEIDVIFQGTENLTQKIHSATHLKMQKYSQRILIISELPNW